nr:DpnII family type II restriction endonuclease [Methanobrevibacter ruminantium]
METKFGEILERYPEVVVILPNILAVRDKKLDVLDLDSGEFKNIEFKSKKFNKDEIINFCKGLI